MVCHWKRHLAQLREQQKHLPVLGQAWKIHVLGNKDVLVSWSETSAELGSDLTRSVIFPLPRGSRFAPTAGGFFP